MKVVVEMTIDDLADGKICHPSRDPVAFAIKRAIPGRPVDVYRDGLIIGGDEIKPPASVTAFVDAWDGGLNPDPITFEIEVSDDEAVL